MKRLALAALLLFVGHLSHAGTFDCSTIYDEYDSLMQKNFLLSPQKYVPVKKASLSRAEYNSQQKGTFLLSEDSKNWGIAIVHTNRNTWGKFLFTWGAPFAGGQPSLLIKKLTLFGRVLDGYAPRITSQIAVPSSYTVDLDTGVVGGGAEADIWFHNIDGNTMYIEAVNGAEISFPMGSLCASR
jgi:hypothetical protein